MLSLPQFRDHPDGCSKGGDFCAICRMATPGADAWRLAMTGNEVVVCPFGLPMAGGQQTRQKARKAAPDVVEDRLAMECDKRGADGICGAGCASCKGKPTCRQLAEWRDCPKGLWVNAPNPPPSESSPP